MKRVVKIVYILFSIGLLFYLLLPNPDFPKPPPDSVESDEPGDTETALRRAYFTNFTRHEVLEHYQSQLRKSKLLGIPLPAYRLNYPPENSQTLIRDQTRSTFLEEIVHPLRESLFVNGFEPKDPKDDVWFKGVDYRQKVIIKYVPSSTLMRVSVAGFTLAAVWLLIGEWSIALKDLRKRFT